MRREVAIGVYRHALEDAEIYKDEISEFLLGEMEDTFNCLLEDGSDQEVGCREGWRHRLLISFCHFTMPRSTAICL